MTDFNVDYTLNYTFIRENNDKKKQQILEYRDGEYKWTNGLENCLGYFKGCCVNETLCKALNNSVDTGWKIYINSFNENGEHIETIE